MTTSWENILRFYYLLLLFLLLILFLLSTSCHITRSIYQNWDNALPRWLKEEISMKCALRKYTYMIIRQDHKAIILCQTWHVTTTYIHLFYECVLKSSRPDRLLRINIPMFVHWFGEMGRVEKLEYSSYYYD